MWSPICRVGRANGQPDTMAEMGKEEAGAPLAKRVAVASVLIACVVGFVMGRMGAAPVPGDAVGEARFDWTPLESGWDLDISSPPGASFPAMTQPRVDSTSGFGRDKDQERSQQ